VIAKIGIKAFSLLASAVFAMIVVVGCNPEEPAPSAAPSTPAPKPSAGAPPTKEPGAMAPPATKGEEKKP
jgi:hypothetical protein